MRGEKGVCVIGDLGELGQLAALGPGFAAAAAFAAEHELAALKPGRHAIDGERVFVNCDEVELVEPASRKVELHHRYFDIHVPLLDEELIGVGKFELASRGTFDAERDIGFFEQAVEFERVGVGEFLLAWPGTCAHAPACTDGVRRKTRKLIFKILAEA